MRRIGVLHPGAADDPGSPAVVAVFLQGMAERGWTDRRNMVIDYRWVAGEAERYGKFARELVELSPDVLVAAGVPSAAALQQATRSIPIVFVDASDPVGSGLVASLARPGGNLTGFALFEYGFGAKWLELLKQIAPGARRVRHSSGFDQPGRHWPACRNPGGSAPLWGGVDFDRRARFRRDRTRRHVAAPTAV
jgi:putative ABC transport system substrate-binding protein